MAFSRSRIPSLTTVLNALGFLRRDARSGQLVPPALPAGRAPGMMNQASPRARPPGVAAR